MDDNLKEELHLAALGHDIVELNNLCSLYGGINFKTREDLYKWPFLHIARTAELTKFFVQKGASVNLRNIDGYTPLHAAIVKLKPKEVLLELLLQGANINATDLDGNTPLTLAIKYEDSEAIKELVEYGADINKLSFSSSLLYSSPMKIAVRDYIESAKVMIKYFTKKHFSENIKEFKMLINLDLYISYPNHLELSSYLHGCLNEIKHMKVDKTCNNVSFYELLYNINNFIPLYISYKDIEKYVCKHYPIYHDLLLPTIWSGIKRGQLLNKLQFAYVESDATSTITITLNSDCLRKITDYLSNEDLTNLLKSICL